MMRFTHLRGLVRNARGSMAIETALIAPALAALALGAFDASMLVAREQHLQSAANEASEIVLAAAGGSGIQSDELEQLLESSLNLTQVTLTRQYRCGISTTVSSSMPTCASGEQMYTYAKIAVTDTYTPLWTTFGIGSAVSFNIKRTVQIS